MRDIITPLKNYSVTHATNAEFDIKALLLQIIKVYLNKLLYL